jgi:hypothetical protein
MPQADQHHGGNLRDEDNKHGGHWFGAGTHGASEGIEKIITKPLSQRHVPGIPELGQVLL